MIDEKERKSREKLPESEELREVLGVVSKEIPALIKGIIGSVFSEEAGRDMGKAAATFYKQLKDAGMPEETAVKMTEDYMSAFTSLGGLLKNISVGRKRGESDISTEVSRRIEEKLREKRREEDEEEKDD